jgi:hypothetical protein
MALAKFLQTPGLEVKFFSPLAVTLFGNDTIALAFLYTTKNEKERQWDAVKETNDTDRLVKLCWKVVDDKVHGGIPAYRNLKNATQRRLWLLECFSICADDAIIIHEMLSDELWPTFNRNANVEDK